jgi:RND family efflux transporter MFP subunit
MTLSKKAVALAAGLVAALSLATVAQERGAADSPSGETLVVPDATVQWIEKSDVAALREGVIKTMELQIGMEVRENMPIGSLHAEMAKLTVAKAKLAAENKAAEEEARAKQKLALAVVATNKRLNIKQPGLVSREEQEKAEAEVNVATAMIHEAIEKRALDKAELELAKETEAEHTIRAPFGGIVVDRMKNPGESVRANEAVVRLANLDKLRAVAFVPLAFAFRVKEGQVVELQVKLNDSQDNPQPIERKRFRGKINFVDPFVQAIAEDAVRVFAEFENKSHELRPGLKAKMTIYLGTEGTAAPPTVSARIQP